jgi:hypothetical protein
MATHYDAHGDSEWACGGDGTCESVEAEPDCVDGLAHRWTADGTGGCDSNPGVWSTGGTSYRFAARCVLCGCGRSETHHGSQRNPGECDSVSYETSEYAVDESEARLERARQIRNRKARARYRRLLPARLFARTQHQA